MHIAANRLRGRLTRTRTDLADKTWKGWFLYKARPQIEEVLENERSSYIGGPVIGVWPGTFFIHVMVSLVKKRKKKFGDKPPYSYTSVVVHGAIMSLIFMSTMAFCIETMPVMEMNHHQTYRKKRHTTYDIDMHIVLYHQVSYHDGDLDSDNG